MADAVLAYIENGDLRQLQAVLGDLDAAIYKDRKRPLHVAAIYGRTHIVGWLLAEGAQVDCLDQGAHTPLHLAAKYGHTQVMELLIRYGANVNAANKAYKLTPMHMAAKEGQPGSIETLIRAGADISVTAKDGVQPLHTAVEKGHKDVVALLIRAGAAPDAKDSIGFTPLHLAIENKHDALVATLLRLGADPDTPNKNLWTPLHLAASTGNATAVKILLEYGANMEAKNSAGKTPMEVAVDRQHAAVVPLLNPATATPSGSADRAPSAAGSQIASEADHPNIGSFAAAHLNQAQLEDLIGDLGLKDSVDAPCPYCTLDPGSFLNSNGNPKLLNRSGSRDSTTSGTSTATAAAAEGVPSLFLCPLSRRVLRDPVVACDGFTYDRRAIQEHFERGDRTSPLTKQALRSTAVLPNHSIRCAVNEWLAWRDRKIQHLLRQQQRQQQQGR